MTDKTDDTIAASANAPAHYDPKAFDAFLNRVAPTVSSGGSPKALRRREATVVVEPDLCEPGMFDEPFQLTLTSLSSADELDALRESKTDSATAHVMAKKAITHMNGRRLKSHEVDVLWEALGFSGRVVASNTFLRHCTGADDVLLGKSLKAVEIG